MTPTEFVGKWFRQMGLFEHEDTGPFVIHDLNALLDAESAIQQELDAKVCDNLAIECEENEAPVMAQTCRDCARHIREGAPEPDMRELRHRRRARRLRPKGEEPK